MNAVTLALLAYIVGHLIVGFVVSRKIRTESDYLVAGRSLGYGLSIFTIFATWFGAETCIGSSGQAYKGGLTETSADPFGYALCLLFMGLIFAVPLYRRGLTTVADLYRQRYGGNVERLVAIILIPTSVLWAAAQIRALGQVLAVTSDLSTTVTILISGGVVIAYTTVGGMWADATNDFIQGIVVIVGLGVLVVVMALSSEPGLSSVTADQLALIDADRPWLATVEIWAVPILGSVVAQELVARVVAARTVTVARRSTLIACALYFVVGLMPIGIGLVAAHSAPGIADPEQVLISQAGHHLPTWLYVVFAGALVSAILSTVDSALLVAGSLLGHNVIIPLRPQLAERHKIRINRISVVAFGAIACGLALAAEGVYALVDTASGLGSAGVFVTMVFALFTGFGGARAASAALITGVVVYVVGSWVMPVDYPFVSSLALALVAYVAVGAVERTMPAVTAETGETTEVVG